jgi:hypothetical protein
MGKGFEMSGKLKRLLILLVIIIVLLSIGWYLVFYLIPDGGLGFVATTLELTLTSVVATNNTVETLFASTQSEPATTLATRTPPSLTDAPTTPVPDCYFNWATQALPELTAEIQSALDAAGLENVTVSAAAYGENCYTYDTNEVAYFAAMQTDFTVTAQVASLDDEAALGDLAAEILTVLNSFPPDEDPGPNPGRITLIFTQDTNQVFVTVPVGQAAQLVEQGLSGAALWAALNDSQN